MLGYVAAILVIFAVLFFFSKQGRLFRALGWAYLIFLVEMIALHGKMYYLAPVYPMMFAAGGVWLERATERKVWAWAKPALALGIITVSAIYAPTILPVLSVPNFLAYEHKMGIEQQKFENQPQGVLPQLYADMFGWQEVAQSVAAYYHTLSPEDEVRLPSSPTDSGDHAARSTWTAIWPAEVHWQSSRIWIWVRTIAGESLIVLGEGHKSNMQIPKCASSGSSATRRLSLSQPNKWLPIYRPRVQMESP